MVKNLLIALNYNNEEYLKAFFQSLYMQDLKDWDLIIVDDCSEDNSTRIIDEYTHLIPFMQIIKNECNLGINASIFKALSTKSKKTGYFVKLIATDDVLAPGALAALSDTSLEVDMVYSDGYLIDESGNIFDEYNTLPERFFTPNFRSLGFYVNFYPAPTACVKVEVLLEALSSFSAVRNAEDWPLLTTLLSSKTVVKKIDLRTVYYRRHNSSLSYSFFNKKSKISEILLADIRKILLSHSEFNDSKFVNLLIHERLKNLSGNKDRYLRLLHFQFLKYQMYSLRNKIRKIKYNLHQKTKKILSRLGFKRSVDYSKLIEQHGIFAVNDLSGGNKYAESIFNSQLKFYLSLLEDNLSEAPEKILDYGCGSGKFFSLHTAIGGKLIDGLEPCMELRELCPRYSNLYSSPNELNTSYDLMFVNNVIGGLSENEVNEFIAVCKTHLAKSGALMLVEAPKSCNYVELTWRGTDIEKICADLGFKTIREFNFYEKNVALNGRLMQRCRY